LIAKSSLARGPNSVSLFKGSPIFVFSKAYFNYSIKEWYTLEWTINLLALEQTCPALVNLLCKAILTANSTGESYVTINGSIPPNSITLFFKCLPAKLAICLPAIDDPVKETPCVASINFSVSFWEEKIV
jgi:hypothetical protein